jgi:ABC-type glutathione transport system ATPase component
VARPDSDLLLRCKDLSIGYANDTGQVTPVVRSVSFELARGASLGIVGESGSGKSTLARALLGFLRPGGRFTGGSLEFGGLDLTRAPVAALRSLRGRQVAIVPQNPLSSLTFHLPVGEQLLEILRTRAGLGRVAARQRMHELLEHTGLPDPPSTALRYPHQLSGGQRQRVVIACALACRPELLVMDEPTTALDKTTEAQVLDLVATLRQNSQTALVLVTHDLNVVARVCERVMVMKEGHVVEQGLTSEVFGAPRTAYAGELLGSVLRIDMEQALRPATATPTLIDVERVGFAWRTGTWPWQRSRGTRVLDDVSVRVGQGEVLGVIGESGSGKTTLALTVAGLLAPQHGAIRLDAEVLAGSVQRRSTEQRRQVQMVFQDPLSSLNPRHTVARAIERPLRQFQGLSRSAAREAAARLLGRLGLDETLLNRYPRQLSGGQQQRVAIARAFAARPRLLICDEITSALDATVQARLLDQLRELQRIEGVAMLLITHDLSVIWRMAPRVVVLRGGRIVEAGPTSDVFCRPSNPYTSGLVEAATRAGRTDWTPMSR